MSGCSGKCGNCKSDSIEAEDLPRKGRNIKDEDIKNFLKTPKQQKEDGSDLFSQCEHYDFGKIQRWQCDLCILEWVTAHSDETVTKAIKDFKENNKTVTSNRLADALKERIWKRKIEDD